MPAPHFDPSPGDGVTRRGFVVLGTLAAAGVAAGCSSSSAPKKPAAVPRLDLTFDKGSLGAPITTHIGARTGKPFAHTGDYGCRLQPTAATKNIACLVVDRGGFALNMPYATFSMFFRLVTPPKRTDPYMNLFEIATTSTAGFKSQFTAFFRDGKMMCDFAYHETLEVGPIPSVGKWHQFQAVVNYSSSAYTADVRIDGGATKTLTSKSGKKPEHVRALYLHYPSVAVDYTMDVDDIKMTTSATSPGFIS